MTDLRAEPQAPEKTYQSVSRTVAVWPLNSGIWSGSFPLSSSGMTANEPPPPASQLTERYFGLTYIAQTHVLISAAAPLSLGCQDCRAERGGWSGTEVFAS